MISFLCSVSWFGVKMISSFMGRLENVEIICVVLCPFFLMVGESMLDF